MKRMSRFLVFGALAVGLTACGSDSKSPIEPNSQLSDEEIEEVMQAAFEAASFAFEGALRPTVGMDAVAAVPIDATGNCPLGGSVAVEGNIDDQTNDEGTGKIEIDMEISWNDCVVQTSKRKLTLDGSYAVDALFNYNEWEPIGDARFGVEGQFSWNGGGATGNCPFKVVYLFDATSGEFSVTGNSCGRAINFTSDDLVG